MVITPMAIVLIALAIILFGGGGYYGGRRWGYHIGSGISLGGVLLILLVLYLLGVI